MTIPIPNGNGNGIGSGNVAGRSYGASYPTVEYDAKTVKAMGNWQAMTLLDLLINLDQLVDRSIKDEATELSRKSMALWFIAK